MTGDPRFRWKRGKEGGREVLLGKEKRKENLNTRGKGIRIGGGKEGGDLSVCVLRGKGGGKPKTQ